MPAQIPVPGGAGTYDPYAREQQGHGQRGRRRPREYGSWSKNQQRSFDRGTWTPADYGGGGGWGDGDGGGRGGRGGRGGGGRGGGGRGGRGGGRQTSDYAADIPPEIGGSIEGLQELVGDDQREGMYRDAAAALREFGARGGEALTESMARRGMTGTGFEGAGRRDIEGETQRQARGLFRDIERGEAERKAGLYRDIAGIGATRAGIAQGDKALAMRANQMALEADRIALEMRLAEEAAARAEEQARLDQMFNTMSMLGGW